MKIKSNIPTVKNKAVFFKVIEQHDFSMRCHIFTMLLEGYFSNYFIKILLKF